MERIFHLKELGANPRTEILAGATTFVTMAYIIFVNPVILSGASFGDTGQEFMDFGAVMTATCIAAAAASIFMGLIANYPIALAPAMGENAVFAGFVAAGLITWQQGLAAVLISGVIFFLLTFMRVREMVIDSIPPALKHAIAVGIGAFIAFLGLTGGGLVGNIPRVLPKNCNAVIKKSSWPAPSIFEFLQGKGPVEEAEMFRVFNMGIGYVLVVAEDFADSIMKKLARYGEKVYKIGRVTTVVGKVVLK